MTEPGRRRRPVLRGCLLGCGGLVLLVVILIGWVGVSLYWGPGPEELSPAHPFRSVRARERFTALYDRKAEAWPIDSENRMLETSYGPTFVRIGGPPEAPPLVLLHGVGGSSLHWAPNIAGLSAGHRTYAVDGIMDSGRSIYHRLLTRPEDFVTWLEDLMTGLGLESEVDLMGISYGGWQSALFALDHPERLHRLVLVAPVATVQPLTMEWVKQAAPCALPHRFFTRRFLRWLCADMAATEAGREALEVELELAYQGMRCFKTKPMVHPTVLTDQELRSLQVPVLFVVGENEKIYDPEKALDRLHRVAPAIETERIVGAGHDLTLVRPGEVNRRVLQFLEGP